MVDQPLVGEGQCSHSHPTDRLQHTRTSVSQRTQRHPPRLGLHSVLALALLALLVRFSSSLVSRGGELLPAFGPLLAFGHHALSHANTRAAGAPHALLHAHRVKTARTSPRARKHTISAQKPVSCASALCWHPMAAPAARTSHAPLAPSELAARPLTPRRARRSEPH